MNRVNEQHVFQMLALAWLVVSDRSQLLAQGKERPMEHPTLYRTVQIDGLVDLLSRSRSERRAHAFFCCTGLPSSSRMFEPSLRPTFRPISSGRAGLSGIRPQRLAGLKTFAYTFDHIAEIMNHFTEALGLSRYTLYMQDYGGPVGFRMALAHPERVEALIVQDAVAHNDGLGANWKTRREFWKDRAANETAASHKSPLTADNADAP